MMDRKLWLALGAACVCWPAVALAQVPPSHRSLRTNLPDPATAETILRERLDQANTQGKQRDLRKLFGNKALLRELTKGHLTDQQMRFLDANSKQIEVLLRDPRFLALLDQSMAARRADRPLSEQQIEALRNLANSGLDPSTLPPLPENPAKNAASAAAPEQPDADAADQAPLPDAAPAETTENWFERQWKRLSSSVVDELSDPNNSGAFENALRSLGGIKPGVNGVEEFNMAGLWGAATKDMENWAASRWQWPGKLADSSNRLYRDVRFALPEIGGSIDGVLARIPAPPAAASESGSIQTIALLVAGLALAVAGWKIIERRGARAVRLAGFDPGSWPVKPQAVANREDLIRAFEYLAALRLGAEGRTTNHRAVAARLGDATADDDQRAAARELARLYERARYEPRPAELDDATLTAARRDLALLARAAA